MNFPRNFFPYFIKNLVFYPFLLQIVRFCVKINSRKGKIFDLKGKKNDNARCKIDNKKKKS